MSVTEQYKKPDTHIMFNDGDDLLHPIKVNLPTLEDWMSRWLGYEISYDEAIKLIDGYGKAPQNQKFEYQEIPEKLRIIESVVRKKLGLKTKEVVRLDQIDNEIVENQKFYEKEILWMKKQIRRSYLGYWCFINGKPTYLTGQHYNYINFWPIGNNTRRDGRAEYRDRDRRWYHFIHYCRTTTDGWFKYKLIVASEGKTKVFYCNTNEALKNYKEEYGTTNVIIEDAEGGYIVDTGVRQCYGLIYPKHRREGATSRAAHGLWYGSAMQGVERKAGIQSITDDQHARPVFNDHVVKRLRRMPFFFQLMTSGSSAEAVQFTPPQNRSAGAIVSDDSLMPHDGWINYKSSGERAYDGEKMHVMLHDEIGKMSSATGVDVYKRYEVVRKTLAQGDGIHGFIYCTSTLGEMQKGGGEAMRKMVMNSLFRNRDDNGMTYSGLLTLFFPAYDGYDGFIDEYGASVIENPKGVTPPRASNGKMITTGSQTYLENRRRGKIASGDESGYVAEVQDFPFTLLECFMSTAKGSAFPIKRIRERITALMFEKSATARYRLEWIDGKKFGKVAAIPDVDGLHTFSHLPIAELRNLKTMYDDGTFGPSAMVRDKGVIGADPMMFSKDEVDGKKKSYQTAVSFMKRDYTIDPEEILREDMTTERFIHTFKDRDLEVNSCDEEIAKVCILLGWMLYPENNIPRLYQNFKIWGLDRYLLYDMNPETGERANKPGGSASGDQQSGRKQDLFQEMEEHLKRNVERENHIEILEDCQEIVELKDMTKYDIFAASGWALLGAKSNYHKFVENYDASQILTELPVTIYYQ
jgi:hypothetical protein